MIWRRWRWAILLFYLGALSMAAMFGAVVMAGGSPVTPELYGPIVYAVPAMAWVGMQAALALLAIVGAAIDRPWIAGTGAFGMTILLMFFGIMGMDAGAAGTLLVTGTIAWLGPLSAIAALICFTGVGGVRR